MPRTSWALFNKFFKLCGAAKSVPIFLVQFLVLVNLRALKRRLRRMKYNLLSQSAQAMLSQANQNASNVLGFIQ